ncbi:MAG: type II toxin-antitoxin system HicB family antitoxin [Hyphomonadaceae bacterium]
MSEYEVLIMPLSEDDGGGYVAVVPDLIGCFSDGETREEAACNVEGAITEWIATNVNAGRKVPEPGLVRTQVGESENRTAQLIKDQQELIESQQEIIEGLYRQVKDAKISQNAAQLYLGGSQEWTELSRTHTGRLLPLEERRSAKTSKLTA